MKRAIDIISSFIGLITLSPFFFIAIIAIWLYDYEYPFYIAIRVGQHGKKFNMIKLRSMIATQDTPKIESTSSDDNRITPVGRVIRKYKLDEFIQLWNVFIGDMSLVGPRPNTVNGVAVYTNRETLLLSVKPGITDFASIIFSDEGEILLGHKDPDLSYDQLIRPWKSRLGIIYIENQSLWLDFQLIFYTFISLFSKEKAIIWIIDKLNHFNIEEEVIKVSSRKYKLEPSDLY